MHQRIYRASRAHDAGEARSAMNEHLVHSSAYQVQEAAGEHAPVPAATPVSEEPEQPNRPARRRARRRTP
jgi:hypothetical protein